MCLRNGLRLIKFRVTEFRVLSFMFRVSVGELETRNSGLETIPALGLMKVLHVIPSVSERSGGPGQAIFPMCRALQAQGIDVTIATTDHGIVSISGEIVSSSEFQVSSSPTKTRNLELETRNSFKGVPTIFFPS